MTRQATRSFVRVLQSRQRLPLLVMVLAVLALPFVAVGVAALF